MAQYGYKRARALGADEADIGSSAPEIESVLTVKQAATASVADWPAGARVTRRVEKQGRESLSGHTGERVSPASVKPAKERNLQKTRSRGRICPHSGHCLTPP